MSKETDGAGLLEFSMQRGTNERTPYVDLEVMQGDITTLQVDAVVNAAHDDLTGGGGVDGAIHAAAGQQLLGECLNLYGCPEGESRITSAYEMPCKYIIHTVGPVWTPNKENQEDAKISLMSCYGSCLEMAERQGLKSIAFPCISTGAYAFPKDQAARISIMTIKQYFEMVVESYIDTVVFVCWGSDDFDLYKKLLEIE